MFLQVLFAASVVSAMESHIPFDFPGQGMFRLGILLVSFLTIVFNQVDANREIAFFTDDGIIQLPLIIGKRNCSFELKYQTSTINTAKESLFAASINCMDTKTDESKSCVKFMNWVQDDPLVVDMMTTVYGLFGNDISLSSEHCPTGMLSIVNVNRI
jgi:hypothetical protein